jgi:hypothetical protein
MLVIPRRRFLSPEDLFTTAAVAAVTKEAKTTQDLVKLRWLGLFVELLGRFPTGSSLSASRSHDLNLAYHSLPLCTTSYP